MTRGSCSRALLREEGLDRAEEHFKAVLAADPTFELASPQADAEEIEAFRAVKPAPASAPVATTTPAPPEPREKTPR